MERCLIVALTLLPLAAVGAPCAVETIRDDTKVHICSPTTVRVTHAATSTLPDKAGLVVNADWGKVDYKKTISQGVVKIEMEKLTVLGDTTTGKITFTTPDGKVLTSETGHSLSKIDDMGTTAYRVQQNWTSQADEALYGGGEYQNGLVNWKGESIHLLQFNTEAAVPFFVSSYGYGLLWDIYSDTQFNAKGKKIDFDQHKTATLTTGAAGDYSFYASNCPTPSFGCGGNHELDLILKGEGGETIDVFNWSTTLRQVPVGIAGRATLKGNTKYTATLNTDITATEIYYHEPTGGKSLTSEVADMIDYYFMYGGSVDGAIAQYRQATGVAYLYGKYAYGFWQCKEHYHNQSELLDAAKKFRQLGIPVDSIVQDWHYWGSLGWGPQWDPKIYPDPAGMVKTLKDLNFHFMVSVWSKFDKATSFFKNMTEQNMMINGTVYYDPYNPAAREQFYQFSKTAHFSIGVDALWLDATEPEGLVNVNHMVHLGTGNKFINPYSLMTSKAIADGLRRDYGTAQGARVFSLTRSSFAGQQRTGATLWSGDIAGTWDTLRRQIALSINYQLSGIPYWSEDIGGFVRPGDQYTSEDYHQMLTRWFQFGAFTPIFRVHGGGSNTELWNYGEAQGWIVRSAISLRYRLLPYIYSGFARVEQEGYTMQRGLVFDFTADHLVHSIADQFMWGDAFLVAPIYTPGIPASRPVYLPASTWYSFFDGTKIEGGRVVSASCGIEEMPLYVRAGSIVPMGPVVQHTGETQDPTEVRVYAGRDGSFVLYEDDGMSNSLDAGHQKATVAFTWDEAKRELTVGERMGSFPGMLTTRTFNVVLVNGKHGAGIQPTPTPDHTIKYTGSAVTVKL